MLLWLDLHLINLGRLARFDTKEVSHFEVPIVVTDSIVLSTLFAEISLR